MNAVDPSGLDLDPLVDGPVLSLDGVYLLHSIAQHDAGGALVNTGIFIGDALLSGTPLVPPLAGGGRALELVREVAAQPIARAVGRLSLSALIHGVYYATPTVEQGCPGFDVSRSAEMGRQGESAVEGSQNQTAIESESGTAKFRRPDRLTQDAIGEVKNVKRLGLTKQLRDYIAFAKKEGIPFNLTVRENTKVYGPLQDAADQGNVILHRTLPGQ